jgi:hypothetical protein
MTYVSLLTIEKSNIGNNVCILVSPVVVVILHIQNIYFFILATSFLIQILADYLSHFLLYLSIIIQCIFYCESRGRRER